MSDVLWTSFGNVVHAVKEGEALLAALTELLAEGALPEHSIDLSTEYWNNWADEDDWVATYYLLEWKLKAQPRNRSAGQLTIALSYWRPEDEKNAGWDGSRRAKLYVAYSSRRKRIWDSDTLVLDGSGRSLLAGPASDFLWTCVDDDQALGAWFFCVRALDLESRDDLVREIITPLGRLLANPRAPDAFAGASSTVRVPSS